MSGPAYWNAWDEADPSVGGLGPHHSTVGRRPGGALNLVSFGLTSGSAVWFLGCPAQCGPQRNSLRASTQYG